MNVYHEYVQHTAAAEHFIQCNAIGLDRHRLVNRASFAEDVSCRVQFEQIGWNVRNSPKLSFTGGATNGNDWVDRSSADGARKGTCGGGYWWILVAGNDQPIVVPERSGGRSKSPSYGIRAIQA